MSTPRLPPGSGRPRRAWTLPLLLILVVAVPIAEIWVLLRVGNWIGLLPTIGLLLVLALLGTWLSRREGGRAWRGINEAVRTGQFPSTQMADGAMVVLGAVLLVFPGFLTDIVALLFLLPLTRPFLRRLLGWSIARQAKKYVPEGGMLPPFSVPGPSPRLDDVPPQSRSGSAGSGEVIEGEIVDERDSD